VVASLGDGCEESTSSYHARSSNAPSVTSSLDGGHGRPGFRRHRSKSSSAEWRGGTARDGGSFAGTFRSESFVYSTNEDASQPPQRDASRSIVSGSGEMAVLSKQEACLFAYLAVSCYLLTSRAMSGLSRA